jgi:hypothetical protein
MVGLHQQSLQPKKLRIFFNNLFPLPKPNMNEEDECGERENGVKSPHRGVNNEQGA